MNLVTLHDGRPVTTSRKIAAKFSRNHKDVLKAIRMLDCSRDFGERNFAPTYSSDSFGRQQPEYILTRESVDRITAQRLGRQASALSNEKGYNTGRVKDARYGSVKSYHIDILKLVF